MMFALAWKLFDLQRIHSRNTDNNLVEINEEMSVLNNNRSTDEDETNNNETNETKVLLVK